MCDTIYLAIYFYLRYFKIIFYCLCYYSCPDFPPLPLSTQHPQSLRQSSHCCSCPWVMLTSSLATQFPSLYFTSPWLFCNHLFVLLNPLTFSHIPPYPLLSNNHQTILHIYDSVPVLVCLICFLDSIVDRCVFMPILLFIVLIFFLNNTL